MGVWQHAEVECKAMDTAGATEATTIARFRRNDVGVRRDSTVPRIANGRVDLATAAGSIVAAVPWCNLQRGFRKHGSKCPGRRGKRRTDDIAPFRSFAADQKCD